MATIAVMVTVIFRTVKTTIATAITLLLLLL